MLSERQLDANRRNAQLSTGPRTPNGRAAVSLNALRHGLTAQTAVLPNENPEEFRELRDAFFAEYHPAGPEPTTVAPIEGRDPLPLFRPKHRRTAFSGNHLPNTIDLELLRNEPLQRSLQVPPVLGLDNLAALGPVHHDRHAGVRVTR